MSLSRHIQSPELFAAARGGDVATLRSLVMQRGEQYFREQPDERDGLAANLRAFGFEPTQGLLDSLQQHVLLHYYEKLIPVIVSAPQYADYLANRVDATEALAAIAAARLAGRACLLALAHFGAVELITPLLALKGLSVSAALRFTTPQFSAMAREQAAALAASGRFGEVRFIEVGKPGTPAALAMAAVLRAHGILLSVFDEQTDYSVQVRLRGRSLWGGAGLDRLLRFCGAPVALFATFMLRTGEERYGLVARRVPPESAGAIQTLYDSLQQVVEQHPEQWYFLHEEIPFAPAQGSGP